MNKYDMKAFGFCDSFSTEAAVYPGLYVGRVVSQYNDLYKVVCENGEMVSKVSGRFRYNVKSLSAYPAVGDFVMLDRDTNADGNAVIHAVLKRKSAFVRKMAGTSKDEQIIASNIDTVFICMSLNKDFNLRRVERYLSIAWDSGAVPVVVLTKADLCDDIEQKLRDIKAVAFGADVIVTSGVDEHGYLAVTDYLKAGQTIAFIGSSGVGKSTLINLLMGEERFKTKELRNDDKGRHTTTRRELILLANGGMVIDTPGMREIGIENADFNKTFTDIDELSSMCKFNDCTHANEPGCAVQRAVSDGLLSGDRLLNYQKLKKEAKYQGLNSKQIEHAKINEMFGGMAEMKNMQKSLKERNRRRSGY